jgi:hypothetical protein
MQGDVFFCRVSVKSGANIVVFEVFTAMTMKSAVFWGYDAVEADSLTEYQKNSRAGAERCDVAPCCWFVCLLFETECGGIAFLEKSP